MDFAIQLVLMSDIRFETSVFLITGLLVYLVEYRMFRHMPSHHREASATKAIAYVYVIGSIVVFLGLQCLSWFI